MSWLEKLEIRTLDFRERGCVSMAASKKLKNALDAKAESIERKKSACESASTEKLAKKTKKKYRIKTKKVTQLILDNQEHGLRLAWSFLKSWRMRLPQDEVKSVVGAALCDAAVRFDDTRGVDFKTFFFYHLRGMLLKEVSRVISEQKTLQFFPNNVMSGSPASDVPAHYSVFPQLVDRNSPQKIMEQREVAENCWRACEDLDQLEQEVIVRYFAHDEPLVKIAEDLEYCRCHISRVKSRALKKLGNSFDSFSRAFDGSIDEVKVTRTSSRATRKVRKSYTGGRGRRGAPEEQDTSSSSLKTLLANVS